MNALFRKSLLISVCLLSINAYAACDCTSIVSSAYMKQVSLLKAYYENLQNEIHTYSQNFDIYSGEYAKSLARREALLGFAQERLIATKNQKKLLQDIVQIQATTVGAKSEILLIEENQQKNNN